MQNRENEQEVTSNYLPLKEEDQLFSTPTENTIVSNENKQEEKKLVIDQENVKQTLQTFQKSLGDLGNKVGSQVQEQLAKAEFTPDHLLNYARQFFGTTPSAVLEKAPFDIITVAIVFLVQSLFLAGAFYTSSNKLLQSLTFGVVNTLGFVFYLKLIVFSLLSAGVLVLNLFFLRRLLLKTFDLKTSLERAAKLLLPLNFVSPLATLLGLGSPSFALFLLLLGALSSFILYVFEVLTLTSQDSKQRDSFYILYFSILLHAVLHFVVFYLIVQ